MTTATALDIETFLARESFASALASWVDGVGSDAAVAAALAQVERCELTAERAAFTVGTSHYAMNVR